MMTVKVILCLMLCLCFGVAGALSTSARAANTNGVTGTSRAGFAPAQAQRQRRRGDSRRAPRSRRERTRKPDVIFLPTPPETVAEMLRLAKLKPGDVLYDLGSGDGRIPIAAARDYGVRAVGIDIDPALVAKAQEHARQAGVTDRVTFRQADLFHANISEASVVTLYLSNALNERLLPKLLRELRPGTRIISHDFKMGNWKPEQTIRVPWLNLHRTVYVWTVPARGSRNSTARTTSKTR